VCLVVGPCPFLSQPVNCECSSVFTDFFLLCHVLSSFVAKMAAGHRGKWIQGGNVDFYRVNLVLWFPEEVTRLRRKLGADLNRQPHVPFTHYRCEKWNNAPGSCHSCCTVAPKAWAGEVRMPWAAGSDGWWLRGSRIGAPEVGT